MSRGRHHVQVRLIIKDYAYCWYRQQDLAWLSCVPPVTAPSRAISAAMRSAIRRFWLAAVLF